MLRAVNTRSYELVNAKGNIIRRNSSLLTADKTRSSMSADLQDFVPLTGIPSRTGTEPVTPAHTPSPASRQDMHVPANPSHTRRSAPRDRMKNVDPGPVRRSERIRKLNEAKNRA